MHYVAYVHFYTNYAVAVNGVSEGEKRRTSKKGKQKVLIEIYCAVPKIIHTQTLCK